MTTYLCKRCGKIDNELGGGRSIGLCNICYDFQCEQEYYNSLSTSEKKKYSAQLVTKAEQEQMIVNKNKKMRKLIVAVLFVISYGLYITLGVTEWFWLFKLIAAIFVTPIVLMMLSWAMY